MRKSYYTNGYTNDHDPTYYRDSYEQAPSAAGLSPRTRHRRAG